MRSFGNYKKTFTMFTNSQRYVRFRERRERRERFYRTHEISQKLLIPIYRGKTFTTFTTFTRCHNVIKGRSCS